MKGLHYSVMAPEGMGWIWNNKYVISGVQLRQYVHRCNDYGVVADS